MVETIKKIISAVHYKYEGASAKVNKTDVYFNDGTKLALDGYWDFKVGESYRITYTNGNPVDVESVVMITL